MPRVCVLLAPGFEEIEAITVIDVLRRAEIDTTIVAVNNSNDSDHTVEGSHGIAVRADTQIDQLPAADDWDMVVLPGGMPGSSSLRDDPRVQRLLVAQHQRQAKLAAICAAPIALSQAGALHGKKATSYPSFAEQLACADYLADPVVVDGHITTSRAPGTALAFALELVQQLQGADTSKRLSQQMLVG